MQELKKKSGLKTDALQRKTVTIFLQSDFFALTGTWHWDFHADAVFCSDVMLSIPMEFTGVKSIFHPDDLPKIMEQIEAGGLIPYMEFRIITTYGEVRTITGEDVTIEEKQDMQPVKWVFDKEAKSLLWRKEYGQLQLLQEIYEKSERFTGSGIWFYNTATNETWYSNFVFRIFELPPNSLNAHRNTFSSFIHPEDREAVEEYIDKAYKQRAPLHIEYRIRTASGEKYIRYTSQWFFSSKGETVLSGTIQDITDQKSLYSQNELLERTVAVFKQQQVFDEQQANLAHWQVDLVTRKSIYSDHFYRLFGLKPQPVSSTFNTFINYVHHEDRQAVEEAYKAMLYEHRAPELEYRVIRSDGKIRFLVQKARLMTYGNEIIMAGTLQDITVQKMLEKKLAELSGKSALKKFVQEHTEQTAGAGSWVWNTDTGKTTSSESFYRMLGLKPNAGELTQKQLLSFVHPEDQERFTREISLVQEEGKDAACTIRFVQQGQVRHMKVSFRQWKTEEGHFMVGTVQDISKEYLLQQQLNHHTQLVEALTQNILDRLIITDTNHTVLVWNGQCEKIYGIPKEEAVGRNFFDVFPELRSEEEMRLLNAVLKGESITSRANRSVVGKGYYDLHVTPLWNIEGKEVAGIIHIIHDVTKEVELRQHLNERLSFIENLVESSVDRIIAMDRNLNYLVWNKKCEEHYGLRKEEVIGKNVLEVFPNAQDTPAYYEFRKVLKGETIFIPASREAGRSNYNEVYLIPVKDEKEQIVAVLWIQHDLSNEFDLINQQKKSADIVNALNENYFELDAAYRLVYMNPKAEDFFGLQNEEARGELFWELMPGVMGSPIHTAIREAMQTQKPIRGEYILPVNDTVVFSSIVPSDEGVGVIFFDLGGLKEAEQKVQESRDLLQAVFDASLDGIILLQTVRDSRGAIEDYEVVLSNRVTREWNGRDLIGLKYFETFPSARSIGLFEGFAEVMETGAPLHREIFYQGEIASKWYRITAVKIGDGLVATAEDITERKKAEEEVHKNLSILRYTEYLSQTGNWEYNVHSGELTWSEGMYRMFGLAQGKEVRPGTYVEAAVEEDRGLAKGIMDKLEKGHDAFEEILRIRKGESIRRIKSKGSVVYGENGAVQKMIGVDIDVTEVYAAREKLKEHQELLQQTTMATPDAITIYELENKQPYYLNNCLSEWTGKNNEELVQMGHQGRLSLVHPDDRSKLIDFNDSMLHAGDGEVRLMEYRLQTEKGLFWIRNRAKVFKRNESGTPTHILSVLQDFTEEVILRERLMERTQYAETIIDASIDCISVFDKDLRILAWNKRSEQVTGFRKEKLIGRRLFDVFPKLEENDKIRQGVESARAGQFHYTPAEKAIYSNGYYERYYVPLHNAEDETYAVLCILHEVTDSVLKQEELRGLNQTLKEKNNQLEQKHEEITHFSFVASHDLKEPLRKISTFANWLLENEMQKLSIEGKTYVAKMNKAVKRMEMLIEDILVLTKIHSDRHKKETTDLNKVLGEVKEEMARELGQSGAVIEVGRLPAIKANPNQVFYLFRNLISNAIKFQKEGNIPEIEITWDLVDARSLPDGTFRTEAVTGGREFLRLSFRDNGFGFDSRYAKKIFQIFQRLHGKHEFEGTGIGLAICKKIMDNHEGMICVQSEEGKGSVFTCYFPVE